MTTSRSLHTATRLKSGKVLISGSVNYQTGEGGPLAHPPEVCMTR